MPLRLSPRAFAYTSLVAVVFIWGATFPMVKAALADCSPLLYNLLRMALSTLVLLPFNWRSLRAATPAQLRLGAFGGVLLALGYQFQTTGLARTTPTHSAFITGLVVAFVPLFTLVPAFRPAGSHRPGPAAFTGVLLAFSGLLLLTTPPGTTPANLLSGINLGDVLTLGCAIAFAAQLLALAHGSLSMPPGLLATLQIGTATVVMLLTLPLERLGGGHLFLHATQRVAIALTVSAVFATAIAFTVQSNAQRHLPPTHAVLLLTFEPVFAALTAWLALGDTPTPRVLLGAGLILAGMLAIEILSPATREIPAPA